MEIYSTLHYLYLEGEKEGKARGAREGACRQLGKLLLRHGQRLFGPPAEDQCALLETLVDRVGLPQLELALERALRVPDWAGLLAGLAAPAQRPADPDFLVPTDFDPTPMPPSIDEYARVTMKATAGPAIIHLRLQRLYQDNIGSVLYRESKRLAAEHRCPVQTVVLLLWPGADGPAMTGEHPIPTGGTFRYALTRVWEQGPDGMFDSLATVHLAPLARFAPERLPEIVRRMEEVIETKCREEEKGRAWLVAYGNMGLRYPAEQVHALLAHRLPFIHQLEECRRIKSTGYHAGFTQALGEGALQVTRRWALTLGGQRLGEPPPGVPAGLETIRDLGRLEQLAARALKGASWQEVLAPN
jgi:hypothetical protein